MKRLWLALVIGVFLCASVHAREYMGLQPGRSTRADADRVLGKAIGSGPEDGQADYDPADHGVARLTVNFDDRGIIRSINLYPPKAYPRQKMIEWLELEAPDRMQRNADGALEEIYSAQGIILTFVPGDMTQVIQLTHFYAEKPPAAKAVSKTQAPKTQTPAVIAAGKTPYFGVSTVLTDAGEILILQVHMESPAAAAGLQVEDVLLRLGDYRMQPPVTDKAALEKAVQSPPTGTAAPLVFRRRGEKIRRTVTLAALSDSELAARKALTQEQIDLAADFYQRANLLRPNTIAKRPPYSNKPTVWMRVREIMPLPWARYTACCSATRMQSTFLRCARASTMPASFITLLAGWPWDNSKPPRRSGIFKLRLKPCPRMMMVISITFGWASPTLATNDRLMPTGISKRPLLCARKQKILFIGWGAVLKCRNGGRMPVLTMMSTWK